MQEIDRFIAANWDFFGESINGIEDIWAMAVEGFPVLRWQDDVPIVMPTYTVTFDPGNHGSIASGQSVQTVTHDEEAIPPTILANPGYRFLGWGISNFIITSDFVFKAKYIYIGDPGDGDPGDGDPGDGDPGDGDPGNGDPGDGDPGNGGSGNGGSGNGGSATKKEMDGNGTPSNPYVIRNVAHLLKVNENLSAHYILANNIYINRNIFTQALIAADNIDNLNDIFTEEPFTGRLNGQGYVIDRLIIRNDNSYNGLFGKIGFGGVVENLGLTDTDISGNNFSGAITGYNNGTIRNCFSTGSIHGQSAVGGLVGQNHYGVIVNCYSHTSITGFSQAGGLVGSNNGSISKCYSIGQVMSYYHHGGLIGDNNGSVQSSFWNIQGSGLDSSNGGIGLTDFQMQYQDNFTDWDFSYHGSWKMSDARGRFGGYPILMWQNNMFSPRIIKVEANQRTDGSGIVEISYILNDAYGDHHRISIMLSSDNGNSWQDIAQHLSGDIGEHISPGNRLILWNSMLEMPGEYGENYKIKVTANDGISQEYSDTFVIDNRHTDITIIDVFSGHFSSIKHACFIDDVCLEQSVNIKVFWAGKTPSHIKWYRGENVIANDYIDGDTISRHFNVGKDFDEGENLFIEAISVGGDKSQRLRANFDVIPSPPGIPSAMLSFSNEKYTSSDFQIGLPRLTVDSPTGDEDNKLADIASVSWSPNIPVIAEVDLNGYTEIKRRGRAFELKDFEIAGMRIDGSLNVVMTFEYINGSWRFGGGFDLDAYGSYTSPPTYVVFMVGPVPVPVYYGFGIDAYGSANCQFISGSAESPVFSGDIQIGGGVEGRVGAGISGVACIEGRLRGGLNFEFQVPEQPYLKEWYLTLDGGIKIVLWPFSHEEEFLSYRWPQAQGAMISEIRTFTIDNFQPMSRDYLAQDYAQWHGDAILMKPMDFAPMDAGDFETTLQSNIFNYSYAKLATHGGTKCLVWLYDEPTRNELDRTMLVYSINSGNGWSPPEAVSDNGRADGMPTLATDTDGNFIVTWANASELIPDGTLLNEFMDKLDVKMAVYDALTNTWTSETVVSGAGAHHSPKIVCNSNGEITVLWISDADSDIVAENPPVSNTLFARTKTASGWQDVQLLDTTSGIITYTDVEIEQGAIHVVYSVDTDSDLTTDADNELFYVNKVDGIWLSPLQLTDDEISDVNPQFVKTSWGLVLLWARDGRIVSATDFIGMTDVMAVVQRQGSSGQRDFTSAISPTDNISVIWNDTSSAGSDLFTVTYDPVLQTWSDIVQITDKRDMERSISATYLEDDRLMLAYNKVHIIEGEGLKVFDQVVDLCVYEYKIGADIAVVDGSIVLDDPNALPGDTVNLMATIVNEGDIAVTDIPVAFYCGDTADFENQIGQTQIVGGDMPAGSSVEVSVSWTIPVSDKPLNIIVVADPDFVIQDKNRSNNIQVVTLFKYDLALDNVQVIKDTKGDFYITIDVANIGHHYIGEIINISASCAKDKTKVLTEMDILPPGPYKITSYTLVIESQKLSYGKNDLAIVIDATEKLVESSKLNNIRIITLRNSPAADLNMDGKVDILDLVILSENWLVDSHRNIANISSVKKCRTVNLLDFKIIAENWGRMLSLESRSDIDNSGLVNLLDFAILARHWASTDCTVDNNFCSGADINLSGHVDIDDLLILADNWLIGIETILDL